MTYTTRHIAWLPVLTWVVLGLSVSRAGAEPPEVPPSIPDDIQKITAQLGKITLDLGKIQGDLKTLTVDLSGKVSQVEQQASQLEGQLNRLQERVTSHAVDIQANRGRLELVEQGVASLEKQLTALQARVASAEQQLQASPPRVAQSFDPEPRDPVLQDEIRQLRDQVRLLEERVASIERQQAATPRIARTIDPAPRIGTLRLDNRTPYSATILVNGTAYPVAPLQTRYVSAHPAGTFTYEVLADGFGVIQPPVSRVLRAGETFTIYINP